MPRHDPLHGREGRHPLIAALAAAGAGAAGVDATAAAGAGAAAAAAAGADAAGGAVAATSAHAVLFPFAEYWWVYAGFTLLVLFMVGLDLKVLHRTPREMRLREAALWSGVWLVLALGFNLLLWLYADGRFAHVEGKNPGFLAAAGYASPSQAANTIALQFLAGYLVEESLSIDNIFVFVVIMGFFAVPKQYQHRVLFYGILGALVSRAAFISLGSVLLEYDWVVWVFGLFLMATGVKLLFAPERKRDLSRNWVLRALKKVMPVTNDYHGKDFFVKVGNSAKVGNPARRAATPLFVALVVIEATDIIFAVDSVPAIFGLTREPLVVFTSNIFAILGLRALYFLLAGAIDLFHFLKYGLGIVLLFVGLKMVWLDRVFEGHFPIGWSLAVICGVIGGSVALSLLFPGKGKHLKEPRQAPADQ